MRYRTFGQLPAQRGALLGVAECEDDLSDTSTLVDHAVVDDLTEARSQSSLSGGGKLGTGGAAVPPVS